MQPITVHEQLSESAIKMIKTLAKQYNSVDKADSN